MRSLKISTSFWFRTRSVSTCISGGGASLGMLGSPSETSAIQVFCEHFNHVPIVRLFARESIRILTLCPIVRECSTNGAQSPEARAALAGSFFESLGEPLDRDAESDTRTGFRIGVRNDATGGSQECCERTFTKVKFHAGTMSHRLNAYRSRGRL